MLDYQNIKLISSSSGLVSPSPSTRGLSKWIGSDTFKLSNQVFQILLFNQSLPHPTQLLLQRPTVTAPNLSARHCVSCMHQVPGREWWTSLYPTQVFTRWIALAVIVVSGFANNTRKIPSPDSRFLPQR